MRLIAARPLQRLHQQLPLDVLETTPSGGRRNVAFDALRDRAAEVLGRQQSLVRQQHRALDRVAELADVAGPAVLLEHGHARPGVTPRHALAELAVVAIDVMLRQQQDVTAPLAQRRQLNRHHLQPIEQVFAEPVPP